MPHHDRIRAAWPPAYSACPPAIRLSRRWIPGLRWKRVSAPSRLGRDLEADARARRSFKEQIDDHLAAQRVQAAEGFLGAGLKEMRPVEYGFDFGSVQALDIEKAGGLSVGLHAASGSFGRRSFHEQHLLHVVDFLKLHFDDFLSVVCTVRPIYRASMGSSR